MGNKSRSGSISTITASLMSELVEDMAQIRASPGRRLPRIIITAPADIEIRTHMKDYPVINELTELNRKSLQARLRLNPSQNAECLDSLRFAGMQARQDKITLAEKGTNGWVWNHPSFLDWQSERSSMLWIEGKPGCGKSVLAKSIYRKLQESKSGTLDTEGIAKGPRLDFSMSAAWYYGTREGSVFTGHYPMFRSLLYQILEQDRSAFRHFAGPFRLRKHSINMRAWKWSVEQMKSILKLIARDDSQGLVCIIAVTFIVSAWSVLLHKFSNPNSWLRHHTLACAAGRLRLCPSGVRAADFCRYGGLRTSSWVPYCHGTTVG